MLSLSKLLSDPIMMMTVMVMMMMAVMMMVMMAVMMMVMMAVMMIPNERKKTILEKK